MWKDPIVEEVRAASRKLFRKCGNDIKKFSDYLRQQERLMPPERFIDLSAQAKVKRKRRNAA
ncbi:MAG: hypothetical protein NTX50_28550 [Candidatus Sumerlaeota bacterium]|nr:hypothetical protein [Candidatus Sumerlaeota bacterium]